MPIKNNSANGSAILCLDAHLLGNAHYDLLGAANVQNLGYVYDTLGNLTTRNDYNRANIAETFTYDELNRVKTDTLGTLAKTYSYDAIGNITSKSDFSTSAPNAYSYTGGTCGGGVHAVKSVALKAVVTNTYCYDANGNMTNDPAHTFDYAYTSSNMPANHQKGASFSTFHYGPDRNRIVQTSLTGTTYYLNTRVVGGVHYDMYEKEYTGGIIVNKHYIYGGSGLIAVYASRSNNVNDIRYVHKDHLGSIDTVTNESGAVVERLSYDPWGKRRNPDGTDDTANSLTGVNTHHGYTGHEHIDTVGLIHMNGRVYDPALGRFLSADPTIAYPAGTQGFNRYSYVENNPLSATDPSGYKKFWKQQWFREAAKTIAIASVAWYAGVAVTNSAYASWAGGAAQAAGGAASGAVMGAYSGYQQTGNLDGMMRGAASGAISGGIQGGINGYYGDTWNWSRVATTSTTGGITSAANGGNFWDGARMNFYIAGTRMGWDYMRQATDALKIQACASGGNPCVRDERGVLRTDGARDVDWSQNQGRDGNWLTKSGMASEGLGEHWYDPGGPLDNKYLRYFVTDVSKMHDWFNSWSYNSASGFYLSRGETFDSIFQVYSFTGMPVAGALTAASYLVEMPGGQYLLSGGLR